MNIAMIPTLATPLRAAEALPVAALPGFGDLIGVVATMATAPAASATVETAKVAIVAQPASVATVPVTGASVATAAQQPDIPAPADASLAAEHAGTVASQPLETAAAELLPPRVEPQPAPAVQAHDRPVRPAARPAPESESAQAPAVPITALATVAEPVDAVAVGMTDPAASERSDASGEGDVPEEADETAHTDLPVPPTLPEASRPAPGGPGVTLFSAASAPAPRPKAEAEGARVQGMAIGAAATKPSADPDTAAPLNAVAAEPATNVAVEGAGDGLSSPLFSQALAGAPARPAGQPYPAAAPQAPHQPMIAAQPGQIGRDMGVEIARQVTAGKDEVLIRLDPAEMGRIDVRLSFDQEGSLRAVMAADSPVALDMLRREAGDLSRALADAGVRADPQSFRFDSRGGDAGQPWQRGQQGGDARGGQGGPARNDGETAAGEPVYQPLRSSGRVDLMA